MSKYIINGGMQLNGKVRISGAKNSVLPILAACVLAKGECQIHDVPDLEDVNTMCDLLKFIGAKVQFIKNESRITIDATNISEYTAPYELVNKMRASFLVMGPLLARLGKAKISLPGGCAIGSRPVDLHLKGFEIMGSTITCGYGFVEALASGKLTGRLVYLDFPSVGATENIMMAATLAEGQTIIENAATEPEIVDLATFLVSMGAQVKGAGTDTIKINGVKELGGTEHTIIPDRIEAGTFMVAAAITNGDILLDNVVPEHLKPISAKLREAGVEIAEDLTTIHVKSKGNIKAIDIKTHPYPGFPTDMQAQLSALMTKAEGTSMIVETIFENRFMYVNELKRMGANIKIDGRSAIIEGKGNLLGAQVKATELRAGAALVLAALGAEDVTEISEIHHIDRGYSDFANKLLELGAIIKRID